MNKNTPHILIFERDPKIRGLITQALQGEGLEQACFVEDYADKQPENTVLLCLCGNGQSLPESFKISENDIFEKPLRLGALLDRVKHHHKGQSAGKQASSLKIGPYDLDVANNLLINAENQGRVRLTEKETAILQLLHEQQGEAIGRKALLDKVWGYAENVETHTLETHIYRLRQKIEEDATAPTILLTDENGYKLAD